jgi:CTP:molybdopterin cytidylyltransferase MocA
MTSTTPAIGAIILAAGDSSRLGRPKQTVIFKGETLLDQAIRISKAAGARETIVVLGAYASEIRKECRLESCAVVENPDWAKGMGTSIRRGIGSLAGVGGTLILTCDMPAVTAVHLQMLAASGNLTASLYEGKRGVPAYFPKATFELLSKLEDSRGAGQLLSAAETIALPGGEFDVDTPADVDRLNRLGDGSL